MTVKQLAAWIGGIASVVAPMYALWVWLDSTIVTQQERALSDLTLLMAIQDNRIATYELHETDLTPDKASELEGLRRAKKANECERQKLIRLLAADHSCAQ